MCPTMPTTEAKTEEAKPTKKTVKGATSSPPRSKKGIVYAEPSAVLRGKHTAEGAMTVDEVKAFIGWTEVTDASTSDYDLIDRYGKKIVLANAPSNRPFRMPLAERYANEHVRGKWSFNLESMVADRLGHVQQGQHRCAGFILAEQDREISPHLWGKTPLVLETLLGFGASELADTADTYDTGAKRTLADVIYRHQDFGKSLTESQQNKLSKILSVALKLVWLRVGGETVSFAPHFPHSEAMDFGKKHPKLVDSVSFVVEADVGGTTLITPGYAAGLHYLMQCTEHGQEKADEFWTLFTSGAGLEADNPILTLRQILTKKGADSGSQRDEIILLVIKAWNAWVAGEKMTNKQLQIKKTKDGDKFVNAEFPQLGGIDCTPPNVDKLVKPQLLILSILKSGAKTYAEISEASGLQVGQISKYTIKESKTGKQFPDSLESKGYVSIEVIEDQPTMFKLTAKGTASLKKQSA